MLDLKESRHGGVLVIALSGRLDNESAADFELAAQERLAAGERHLVVDLSGLNYISNAGLRVLATLAKALDAPTTTLRLSGLTPGVRQVFDAAGFSAMFDLYPDIDAALAKHPAGGQSDGRGAIAARLLGAEPLPEPEAPVEGAERLAELILELLASEQQPRAARALAEGTRMVPRVRPEDIAASSAARSGAAPSRPPPRRPWWKRLLGIGGKS